MCAPMHNWDKVWSQPLLPAGALPHNYRRGKQHAGLPAKLVMFHI